MATFAQRGAAAHRNRMPIASGETITIRRGENEAVVVDQAMQAPNSVQILNGDGFPVRLILTDWWLPVDQLPDEPRMGDVITSEDGLTYEPMRLDESTPSVASVCQNKFWLVHTKQTGPAS